MEKFLLKYSPEYDVKPHMTTDPITREGALDDFLKKYSGASFNKGIYRIHLTEKIDYWTRIAESVFPQYKGQLLCFGV